MKAIPAIICLLLLVGCAGIVVSPDQKPTITTDWPSDHHPRGEVAATDLLDPIEYGLRSDGTVVWRTNRLTAP